MNNIIVYFRFFDILVFTFLLIVYDGPRWSRHVNQNSTPYEPQNGSDRNIYGPLSDFTSHATYVLQNDKG